MNTRQIIQDYDSKINMDYRFTIRIRHDEIKKIKELVKRDPERFDSDSHFIRVAIMRLIREEDQRLQPIIKRRALK